MNNSSPSRERPPAVELRDIHKRFGDVHANKGVSLSIAAASVHGIIGENGAGKSTLMSLLYGSSQPDAGSISIDGQQVRLHGTRDAIRCGVGMVHQHFMLIGNFTVAENIVLGAEDGLLITPAIQRARAQLLSLCSEFGLEVDPDARVSDLPVGTQQRVEILKALYRGARILILDEPTAVLTPAETAQLMAVVEKLRQRGTTVVIITHKLKEIMSMTDRVTVLRQGAVVAELTTSQTTPQELAELMVGREVRHIDEHDGDARRKRRSTRGAQRRVPVRTEHLGWRDAQGIHRLQDISLDLHAGEILGIAGVSGNGQSELLLILAGMLPPGSGSFRIRGGSGAERLVDARHPSSPSEMRRLRVAHVPEDRHRMGTVLDFSAWEAGVLGYLDDPVVRKGPFLSPKAMRGICREMMANFDVRPPTETLESSKFSGGNQQKLVLAREFRHAPEVLLIGQPTRGVDIGAIELIYTRLREMRDRGCAVLIVSTELDEILALSDRVAVMSGGHITGILPRSEATLARLGELMGDHARPDTPREAAQ